MLSLANVGSGKTAANYYEAADDYYTDDRCPSAWWGSGAADLGLSGHIDPNQFSDLLEGKLPTGEALHHAASGRRGGTDATFSAPKSISLQALVGGDARLLHAHRTAVDQALAYAETLAGCRVTETKKTRLEHTGNLIIARFEHDLSRACDPQVHTHCVIVNATRRIDGLWRALDNKALYRNKMLLGVLYRSALAREVQALGYEVRITHQDGRFELGQITDRQVKAFSQRSDEIEAYLKDRGYEHTNTAAWVKKLAAVVTRERKTDVNRSILQQEWSSLSLELGIDHTHPQPYSQPTIAPSEMQSVLRKAITHLSEREAVFTHPQLLKTALEYGMGLFTLQELETALKASISDGELICCGELYTTVAAQKLETEILTIEKAGRGALLPIHTESRVKMQSLLTDLTEEQQRAALAVLLTQNQVMAVQGRAGVGKTTLLKLTTQLVEACNYQVKGLAPSASAARELAGAGIAAETIAAFIRRQSNGLTPQTLLIVDEAGMASSVQMHHILKSAQIANCRVLLIGDTQQLAAVEAGKPFAQLQASGMATVTINEIQRQTNTLLKQAVAHAANGEVTLAVELLDKEICQVETASDRFDRIAADYTALTPEEQSQTRVIAGTRYARAEINRRIRNCLGLTGDEETVIFLARKDMTEVERRSTLSYDAGDIVQAEVHYPSLKLKRGEFAKVIERQGHLIVLECMDGRQVTWQPANLTKLSVFVPNQHPLGTGDLVRVTANDRTRGLINGDLAKVIAIDPNQRRLTLSLTDGREVRLDISQPLNLDYGYCSTVYAAQGQTCNRVMIEADSNSLTAYQQTFYVAISRARQLAHIYTDDREMLPVAMQNERSKSSALDINPHKLCADYSMNGAA